MDRDEDFATHDDYCPACALELELRPIHTVNARGEGMLKYEWFVAGTLDERHEPCPNAGSWMDADEMEARQRRREIFGTRENWERTRARVMADTSDLRGRGTA
jgi:hypothetical protein